MSQTPQTGTFQTLVSLHASVHLCALPIVQFLPVAVFSVLEQSGKKPHQIVHGCLEISS